LDRIGGTRAIRDDLAIHAGDEAVQRVEDRRIVIEIVRPARHGFPVEVPPGS
jgi:hypothetical protein